ncbi:DUF5819 family protein [Bacillus cabrialesii]|uniref:DUF5819 family protein n=1 Tax=Bacillus cabrialesii TaxID=2487276 RepID=UPI001012FF51|nr:DUF5819 family protein [Bacillus cabrialesii]UQE78527.1 DUF5819 family protein [Bacillus cabrialesii]
MKKNKTFIIGLLFTLSFTFVVHFFLILSTVLPPNPLALAVKPVSDRYTNTLFQQNWHLFAPDPITTNTNIYMEVDTGKAQGKNEWIDISTPLKDQNHTKIVTPYNRIVRIIDGLSSDIFGTNQDDVIFQYVKKADENDKQVKAITKEIGKSQKIGEENVYRYASSYAKSIYNPKTIKRIRVRIDTVKPVPFSLRDNNEKDVKLEQSTTFKWKTFNNEVVPFF